MHQASHHEVMTTQSRSSMINLTYSQVHSQPNVGGPLPQFMSTRDVKTPSSINQNVQLHHSNCFSESRTIQEPQQVFMTHSFVVASSNFNPIHRHSNLEGQKSTLAQATHNTYVRHSNIETRQLNFQQPTQIDKRVSFNGEGPSSIVRKEGSQNVPPPFMQNPLQYPISPVIKYHNEAPFRHSVQNIQSTRAPFVDILNTTPSQHHEPNSNFQPKSFEINRNVSLSNFFDFDQNRRIPVQQRSCNIAQQNSIQEYSINQVQRRSINRVPDANVGLSFQKVQVENPVAEDVSPKLTSLNVSLVDFNQITKINPQNARFDCAPAQEPVIQNDSQFSKTTSPETRTDPKNNSSLIAVNNSNVKPFETVDAKVSLLELEKEIVSESENLSTDAICDQKRAEIQEPQTRRNFNPATPESQFRNKFINSNGRNTLSLSAEKPRKRNSKLYNQSMINFNSANKKSILKKKGPLNQQEKKKVCINEEDNTKHLVDKYLHQLSSIESVESHNAREPQIIFVPQRIQQSPVFNYPNGQAIQQSRSFTNALANLRGRFMVVQNVDMNSQGIVYSQYVQRK